MPYFSIIIPTYNRAPLLKHLLELFTLQTFNDFEVLVIDDGGTDNSEEVVSSFSDKRFRYFKKQNGGVSSARNFGIERAIGQYINYFDSDDLVYSNHLSEAHKFFTSNPECSVVIFDYDWGDREMKKLRRISNRYKNPNRSIRNNNYISINCILIERQLIQDLRFNEDLTISEDWEYWIKLSALHKFSTVNISTSCIVEHEGRGINTINLLSIIAQKDTFLTSLKNYETFVAKKSLSLNRIGSHFSSLIALNAALQGQKRLATYYFIESIGLYCGSFFSRRSLAIIKHLLFTW